MIQATITGLEEGKPADNKLNFTLAGELTWIIQTKA
jgi:hypothetical protein